MPESGYRRGSDVCNMRRRRMLQLVFVSLSTVALPPAHAGGEAAQIQIGSRHKPTLTVAGLVFRDLNGNGILDPFEDWRLAPERRATDLIARMTLEEKAGVLLHGTAPPSGGITPATLHARYDFESAATLIQRRHIVTLTTREQAAPETLAADNNGLQELAEQTRLGIPLTLSTDPRHHFQATAGASLTATGFSQWPESLGLAAIGDPELVRRFGDIARQEYRAVGLHQALSPMADLATEPRWPRINGTFGEDPTLSGRLVKAYVEGFQHGDSGVAADAVSAVVKHWVGYGAARDGYDSHNAYGRNSALTAAHLSEHVAPFLGAFEARVAGVMPTYSVLADLTVNGRAVEPVGAGFNHYLLTDLLRDEYHFHGIVLSDWAIVNDCDEACRKGFPPGITPTMAAFSTAWGVEGLTPSQRLAKALNAGVDQLGGVDDPTALLQAVHDGLVSNARIDQSVLRILALKFQQGLFDDPYVNPDFAARIVGSAPFVAAGREAQSRSLVVLEEQDGLLPLKPRKLFLYGVSTEVAERYGFTVVSDLRSADVAVVRLQAPYETLHPNYVFGLRQHEGDLAFHEDNPGYQILRAAQKEKVTTIVSVYLDRPAILTNIRDKASLLLADFGVSDTALFDVLTGKQIARGRLPIELPSSMAAVRAQKSDAPHDSVEPLFAIFSGRLR